MSGNSSAGAPDDADAHMAEPDTRRIWLYIVVALVFLVVFHTVAYYWFLGMKDAEIQAKQVYSPDRSLQLQREKDTEALASYRQLDSAKGELQIPVSRAMDLMVQEQSKGKK